MRVNARKNPIVGMIEEERINKMEKVRVRMERTGTVVKAICERGASQLTNITAASGGAEMGSIALENLTEQNFTFKTVAQAQAWMKQMQTNVHNFNEDNDVEVTIAE